MSDYTFFLRGITPKSKGAIKISVANKAHQGEHKIAEPTEELKAYIQNFKEAAVNFFFYEESSTQEFFDSPYISAHEFDIDEEALSYPRLSVQFYHQQMFGHGATVHMKDYYFIKGKFDTQREESPQEQSNRIRYNCMYDAAMALNKYIEDNYEKILATKHSHQIDLFEAYEEKEKALERAIDRFGKEDTGSSISD